VQRGSRFRHDNDLHAWRNAPSVHNTATRPDESGRVVNSTAQRGGRRVEKGEGHVGLYSTACANEPAGRTQVRQPNSNASSFDVRLYYVISFLNLKRTLTAWRNRKRNIRSVDVAGEMTN
jgi:hypothetical protein